MAKYKIGELPEEVRNYLEGCSSIVIDDPRERQHWEITFAHPEFQEDLNSVKDELRQVYAPQLEDWTEAGFQESMPSPYDFALSTYEAGTAPYPVTKLGERWGLSPAALLQVMLGNPDSEFSDMLKNLEHEELSAIQVWETPSSYMIRIPRPLTAGKRKGLNKWLKLKTKDGVIEAKQRATTLQKPSQAMLEAIPWFTRWNAGEAPNEIWSDLLARNPELNFDTFLSQLKRLWERMCKLSPASIPLEPPSSEPGQGPVKPTNSKPGQGPQR